MSFLQVCGICSKINDTSASSPGGDCNLKSTPESWIPELPQIVIEEEKNLKAHKDLAQHYFDNGLIFEQKGEFETAIQKYGNSLKHDPDHHLARYNMGRLMQKKITSTINFNLGKIKVSQGDTQAAMEHFHAAVDAFPSNVGAWINLGSIYHQNGDLESSIRCNKKAISIDAKNPAVYFNLACALHDLKCFDQAIEMYNFAVSFDPMHRDAFFNLGIACEQSNKLEEAMVHYKRAFFIDPTCSEALDAFESLNLFLQNTGNPQPTQAHRKGVQVISNIIVNSWF